MAAGLPPLGDGFEHEVMGTFGQFSTRSGAMSFIQTRARLGSIAGADSAGRLMRHLRPFREVIPSTHLDFSQILQRDIDDYRVAHGLVPYLLDERPGPAFFPPILAVLLPFHGAEPLDSFPEAELVSEAPWSGERSGDAFKWQRLVDEDGSASEYALGRLKWNSDYARLVVLDGQHRCMALLAIDRTHRSSWNETATGAPYREFYESHVQRLLDMQEDVGTYLEGLEVPITVAWFTGGQQDPGKAARQLFVDVNKNAKPPSDSRLILLSDSDLKRVFTRSLLDHVKAEDTTLRHYAVEYDNPSSGGGRSDRWSAITNLELLEDAVDRCVFDPREEWTTDFTRGNFGGGPRRQADEDLRMQREIRLEDIVTEEFEADGQPFKRDDVGRKSFPLSLTDELVAGFTQGWGQVILSVLGEVLPFRTHHETLAAEGADWKGGDEANRLARSAMFDGSGVYWTLEQTAAAAERDADIKEAMDVLLAAHARVQEKGSEFEAKRAAAFLGTEVSSAATDEGRRAYQVFRTQACQLGAIVTVASLARSLDVGVSDVGEFALGLSELWNEALEGEPPGDAVASRRLALARTQASGRPVLNRISDLNARRALLYRYLWLELLTCADLSNCAKLDRETVLAATSAARGPYFADVMRAQKRELASANPDWSDEQLVPEAAKRAAEAMQAALSYWIGGGHYTSWLEARAALPGEPASSPAADVLEDSADQEASLGGENEDESGEL